MIYILGGSIVLLAVIWGIVIYLRGVADVELIEKITGERVDYP